MATGTKNTPPSVPAPPFRQSSPYSIELKKGGGRVALLGLPFFLAGVAMALSLIGVLPIRVEPGGERVGVFASLVFITVGAVMAFGRRWLTVDISRGLLVHRCGLIVPIRQQVRALSEFNAVVMAYDAGDSDSPERYPVRLRSISGKDFVISTPATFGESRKLAEYLSAFLRFPLVDTITDHETVVAAEGIGQTLRERLLAGGGELAQPVRPLKMRCEVTESPGKTTVAIPGGGSWPAGVFSIVMPLVVLLVVIPALLRFFTRSGASQVIYFGVLLLLVVILVLPTIFVSVNLMVGSQRKRIMMTASPAGLEIEQRSAWRMHTTVVPAADLLDLDCSTADAAMKSARSSSIRLAEAPKPGAEGLAASLKRWLPARGIVVKSRTELISVGEGLPAAELQYLSWELRRGLIGADSSRAAR